MRKKLVIIVISFVLVGVSFLIGRWWGDVNASEKLMQEEMQRWDKFAAMDREVLQTFRVRSNAMTSGTYIMQVWFPKSKLDAQEVVLHCEGGQISVPAPNKFNRGGNSQTLSVTGNVVSWTEEGALYEANPNYVGLIDGDEMWGRVYGWNPGDQSIGLWRIYPKPTQGLPKTD